MGIFRKSDHLKVGGIYINIKRYNEYSFGLLK